MSLPTRALRPAPPDPIFGLTERYRADTRPGKVSLAAGVYVDETGTTPVLASVREAERRLAERGDSKAYLPIEGRPAYRDAVRDLVFGADHPIVLQRRSVTVQTPGGTGALRVAADFLRQTGARQVAWLSDPTWPNHQQLFGLAGYEIKRYPWLDADGRRLDGTGMLAALRMAEPGDVVVLHGSCHNPTGVDPDIAAWGAIAGTIQERDLLPVVDFAYQGFGHGLREDADWLAGLARPDLELLVCSSFSKNFALYGERVGALTVIARDEERATAALSHLKIAIRTNYSNPPAHGADIVTAILCDPILRDQWERELAVMRGRISANRASFVDALDGSRVPGDWQALLPQRGMFALLGLSPDQVGRLRDDHAVYLVGNGRINLAGLTSANLPVVADALRTVLAA